MQDQFEIKSLSVEDCMTISEVTWPNLQSINFSIVDVISVYFPPSKRSVPSRQGELEVYYYHSPGHLI